MPPKSATNRSSVVMGSSGVAGVIFLLSGPKRVQQINRYRD
jgi:hypothetical protein